MPAYKSYCWSLGTTSFRMVEFNRKIEEQLGLLSEFWAIPQNSNEKWSSNKQIQTAYYEFIKQKGFIEDRDAPIKDKDAREKTSGLVDLGLINDERRLTAAGLSLLAIAQSGNFEGDNLLQIPTDSFIYFKQLLKLSCPFDNECVRPYVVLAYMIAELGEISKEEFTYLLPLATSRDKTEKVIDFIREIRNGESTIDDAIISMLFEMENYQEAKTIFINANQIDSQIMQEVGMNRKSREYDVPYVDLYNAIDFFRLNHDDDSAIMMFNAIKGLSGKAATYWKQYLFNTSLTTKVNREGATTVNNVRLLNATTDEELREEFFKLLHLFKAKSLLDDYYDLNRRYCKTSDTLIFKDNIVKFDIIPNCYFAIVKEVLLGIAFEEATDLHSNNDLAALGEVFDVSQEELFAKAEEIYGVQVRDLIDIKGFIDRDRYERFNRMIDEKFTDEALINLMTCFEQRNDSEIQSFVTNNADVPTIFEYVLAIVWYKISGRQGNVLEYMNLSLDADLLPITHAAGGHEDITYKYEASADYPAHTLLIEATLANSTNQRRMEMEPVSRHLGDYLLSHEEEAYCVFATTYLHINVIGDFRGRKFMPYYSTDRAKSVDGMKIIPCQTTEIKTMIQRGITYAQLYRIFENAYQSALAPHDWYQKEIVDIL